MNNKLYKAIGVIQMY